MVFAAGAGPGSGRARAELSTQLGRRGPITRDDVAAILLGCLDMPETTGLTFEAFNGDEPIDAALRTLADGKSTMLFGIAFLPRSWIR